MNNFKQAVFYLSMLFALCFLITYALSLGTVTISYTDTLVTLNDILRNDLQNTINTDVICYLRLPRFILALTVGSGLAVCGTVMQAVMKNPLADPYLLGIASGAGLGAVVAIILGFSDLAGFDCVGLFAFGGAIIVTACIILVSVYYGKSNSLTVLLSGMAFNAVCSAIISLILAIYGDTESIQSVTFWLMGSLLNNEWSNIKYLFLAVAVISIFFFTRYRILNLMHLGDDVALTLGHDLSSSRRLYIFLCALVVGLIVYNAGIIGFIGLIIPHIARLLTGNDHLKLLPVSAIIGAAFLVWADVLSRTIISGSEIPIGIIAALFGAPVFIYLLVNKKYGYGK